MTRIDGALRGLREAMAACDFAPRARPATSPPCLA